MHLDWAEITFIVNAYRDTGTYVIASIDDIQLLLDDHLIKAQTMKNSLYIKPFEKETLLVIFNFSTFFTVSIPYSCHVASKLPTTIIYFSFLSQTENGNRNYSCYKASWIIGYKFKQRGCTLNRYSRRLIFNSKCQKRVDVLAL